MHAGLQHVKSSSCSTRVADSKYVYDPNFDLLVNLKNQILVVGIVFFSIQVYVCGGGSFWLQDRWDGAENGFIYHCEEFQLTLFMYFYDKICKLHSYKTATNGLLKLYNIILCHILITSL